MTRPRRHPNVVNVHEVEPSREQNGSRFAYTAARVAAQVGARSIGCTRYEIPAGRTALPFHCHHANEESILVLSGRGTLRLGDDRIEVGPGDYAAFPVGRAHAHQLVNTGDEPLRYLCFSTTVEVDVLEYPDGGKVGAYAQDRLLAYFKRADAVDYFDGEATE